MLSHLRHSHICNKRLSIELAARKLINETSQISRIVSRRIDYTQKYGIKIRVRRTRREMLMLIIGQLLRTSCLALRSRQSSFDREVGQVQWALHSRPAHRPKQ